MAICLVTWSSRTTTDAQINAQTHGFSLDRSSDRGRGKASVAKPAPAYGWIKPTTIVRTMISTKIATIGLRSSAKPPPPTGGRMRRNTLR